MRIEVAFSPSAGVVDLSQIDLADGSRVADAFAASGLAARHPAIDFANLRAGIWSAPCERDSLLRDGDRVEFYRPLRVDPKQARRERSKAHRERLKAQAEQQKARAPKRR